MGATLGSHPSLDWSRPPIPFMISISNDVPSRLGSLAASVAASRQECELATSRAPAAAASAASARLPQGPLLGGKGEGIGAFGSQAGGASSSSTAAGKRAAAAPAPAPPSKKKSRPSERATSF